jgi:NAD dependent epimerase/dehydratase
MNLKDKKILVTGADGFIGSHLTETLVKQGCDVRALVYYNSFNSWGWLDTVEKNIKNSLDIFSGDIRDFNCVKTAMNGCEVIFHLAALIAIPYSYISPRSYVDTNVIGTLNIVQAAKDLDIERVIHTSTSETYGTAQYVPIDEKHPLQGQSPYSATKIAADAIVDSFRRSFGLPVVIARPFNTYGPRQSARAVIPTIITQLLNDYEEIKLGSAHPTRDFTYVQDVCNGFIALAECDEAVGRVINIGSGQEVSIRELAKMIIEQIKPNAKVVYEEKRKRPDKSEVERLLCDNSLIKELTTWKPEISLKEGLIKTIEWFKNNENLDRYKGDIYNV